jgi:hypothetical protein
MIVIGTLDSKLYIRDEYNGRFLVWAIKRLNPDFVEPSASTHLPPPLASTAPLVPSTPLPDGILSNSPAWNPGSRTPGGPLEEQEGGQGPSDRHDTNFKPLPPQRRIPKPAGRVNRKDGYSLKESLGLDEDVYLEIKVSRVILVICFYSRTMQKDIENLGTQHFDLSLPYTKQSEQSRSTVSEEVCGFPLTFPNSFYNDVLNRRRNFIRNYKITRITGLSRTSLPYS